MILRGIKSNIETAIITPAAKERLPAIILFLSKILKKTGKIPITVDKPAKLVKIKAICIKSPINYMKKRGIFTLFSKLSQILFFHLKYLQPYQFLYFYHIHPYFD